MRNPSEVPVMRGTGGLRKTRFAPPSRGRGKSGSMRVGFAQFPEHRRIYVVTMFLKKDETNLNAADRNRVKTLLAQLAEALREGRNP